MENDPAPTSFEFAPDPPEPTHWFKRVVLWHLRILVRSTTFWGVVLLWFFADQILETGHDHHDYGAMFLPQHHTLGIVAFFVPWMLSLEALRRVFVAWAVKKLTPWEDRED